MSKHVLNTRLLPTASQVGGSHAVGLRQAWRHRQRARPAASSIVAVAVNRSAAAGVDRAPPAFEEGAAHPPSEGCQPGAGQTLLSELYRTESPKLIRILARQTGNRADAQDLVHDIFFRLARIRGSLPSLEKPQAFLRQIANNLLKDKAKADFRHSAALHVVADEESLPGFDQRRLLESRDMLDRLEAAMTRLRPKTREIFMAHRIEGMSYAEIAERTGLSVGAVEKQMSKALVQLDRMLNRL